MKAYQIAIVTPNYGEGKQVFNNFISNTNKKAFVISKNGYFDITDYEQIRQKIKTNYPKIRFVDWILGGFISDVFSYENCDIFFSDDSEEERHNKKIELIHQKLEWCIFDTYEEKYFTFSTINESFYNLFKECINTYYPEMLLHDYGYHEPILENCCFVAFFDYGIEGKVAFDIAKLENKAPYIICEQYKQKYVGINEDGSFYDACGNIVDKEGNIIKKNEYLDEEENFFDKEEWVKEFEEKFEFIAEKEKESGFLTITNKIYRVLDYESYKKYWSKTKNYNSDISIQLILSGTTEVDDVVRLIDSSWKDFIQVSNWTYEIIPGGGSDEYHAIFSSNNVLLTKEVCKEIVKNERANIITRF